MVYPLQGVGIPEYYLGGDFKIHKTQEGVVTFTFCAKTYLSNVCEKIEKLLNVVLKQFETPMATSDHPETDDTGFLNTDEPFQVQDAHWMWPMVYYLGEIGCAFCNPNNGKIFSSTQGRTHEENVEDFWLP